MTKTKLSIVIVNWNTRDHLVTALRSIQEHPAACAFEVIVVDNGSTDGSANAVRDGFPEVKLIANSENTGYARGNNLGLEASTGELVLLMNPDIIVGAGALDRSIERLEAHPDAAALGVRQVYPNGQIQGSVRGFPTPFAVLCEATGLSRLFSNSRLFGAYRMNWFKYDTEMQVDQPMGAWLLLNRKALDAIGFLDERFPIFFNEVDWCYRARKAGWTIWFTPEVEVVHFGGASTRLVHDRMAWESRRGLLDYYRKHYPSAVFLPIYLAVAAASWVHAFTVSKLRSRRKGEKS